MPGVVYCWTVSLWGRLSNISVDIHPRHLYIARMNDGTDETVEPHSVAQDAEPTSAIKRFYPQLLILSVGFLVYLNSFNGQLLYDDRVLINAADLQPLWPLSKVLFSADAISRPLVALSLAINYAISGESLWGYH